MQKYNKPPYQFFDKGGFSALRPDCVKYVLIHNFICLFPEYTNDNIKH